MFSLHYPIFESTRTTVRSSSSLCLMYNLCVVCSMFTCAWYRPRPIYFSHHSSVVHCLAALCTDPSIPLILHLVCSPRFFDLHCICFFVIRLSIISYFSFPERPVSYTMIVNYFDFKLPCLVYE